MEVAAVSGCPGGLHCLLWPDSAGPILSVLHRFTLLHVHLGRGDDDPTCLVTQHCLPVSVLRQPHSPSGGNKSQGIYCCYMELFTSNFFVAPWSCLVAFYINDTLTKKNVHLIMEKIQTFDYVEMILLLEYNMCLPKNMKRASFSTLELSLPPSILILFLASCSQESLSV